MSYEKEKEEEGGSFSLGALSVSPARERNFNYRTQRANARTPPFFLLFPLAAPSRHAPIYSAEKKRERGGEGGSSTKGRRRGRQRGFCSLLPPSCLIMRPRPRSPAIESRNKITPRLRWHGRARAPFTTFAPCVSPSSPRVYSVATKKRQERKGEKGIREGGATIIAASVRSQLALIKGDHTRRAEFLGSFQCEL